MSYIHLRVGSIAYIEKDKEKLKIYKKETSETAFEIHNNKPTIKKY
jgi:hypothetical protein